MEIRIPLCDEFMIVQYAFDKEEILYRYKATPGIYFLLDVAEIVYVGQSENVRSRILQHIDDDVKYFNRIYVLRVPDKIQRDMQEALHIFFYSPKYNKIASAKAIVRGVVASINPEHINSDGEVDFKLCSEDNRERRRQALNREQELIQQLE